MTDFYARENRGLKVNAQRIEPGMRPAIGAGQVDPQLHKLLDESGTEAWLIQPTTQGGTPFIVDGELFNRLFVSDDVTAGAGQSGR